MQRVFIFCGIVLIALSQIGGDVSAHKGATGVVKQRMDLMAGIKKNMKTIADMVRGKTPFNANVAADAATDIGKRAAHTPSLFPAGSLHKPSEARAEIWRDWPRFEQLAKDLESAANNLSRTASSATKSGDIRSAFRDLSKVCRSCHEGFRLKK